MAGMEPNSVIEMGSMASPVKMPKMSTFNTVLVSKPAEESGAKTYEEKKKEVEVYRANLSCRDEFDLWVEEFSRKTGTTWNVLYNRDTLQR
jgi:hypothetical protein